MKKIVIIVCLILVGACENVRGALELPAESSESTRNLFGGCIRCGALIKVLVPNAETPILAEIKAIGAYSRDMEGKIRQVYKLLKSLVDTTVDDFGDECSIANPTLRLSSQKSAEILALLRKDLETWLQKHKIFLGNCVPVIREPQ